ncbi:hypothetical protein [Thalassolituus oleivorans]|uniref:hypothetical protein n=1 Tax=Thalassolituus oleivorans TaxID=187493 RepID=UPI0024095092|nr:hypothetical protein [Thalassolituus oleivorans]MDF1641937.1 hypothetical protein [Thalassolituus oleivorans]
MKSLILAALLLPLSSAIFAETDTQQAPIPAANMPGMMGRMMPNFEDFDLDGNGQITELEFNEARAKRMTARAAEGRPMMGMANAEPFATMDVDGNGYLDADEFSAHKMRNSKMPMAK